MALHNATEKAMFAPEVLRGSVEIMNFCKEHMTEEQGLEVISLLSTLVGAATRASSILTAAIFVPEDELTKTLQEYLELSKSLHDIEGENDGE